VSKKPNPRVIGSFVVAGTAVAIGCIVYFGSISLGKGAARFMLLFDESVSGLSEGAKVKVRGVPIGSVKQIMLKTPNQQDDDNRIPVVIEVDLEIMKRLGIEKERIAEVSLEETIKQQVERGLRGQLVLSSMLTGQYYIELDIHTNSPAAGNLVTATTAPYMEIPTLPSQFAEIGQSADNVIARIAAVPFDQMGEELVNLLTGINKVIDELNRGDVAGNLVRSIDDLRQQMESPKLGEAIQGFGATMKGIQEIVENINPRLGPLLTDFQGISSELTNTLHVARGSLRSLQSAAEDAGEMFSPESPIRYRTEEALHNISKAAESVQRLADLLEQNPQSLLTGKTGRKE
jgi:paraquat-inducible protein B